MRCTLHDLAFINTALRPKNIGLVVTCSESLGYALMGDIIELNGERWLAPISDNYWSITSSNASIETQYGKSALAFIPDTWLTPIKAEPLETDETTELELDDLLSV
jgi:hypothetical protein